MGSDGNVTYGFVPADAPECITRPNSAALTLNVRVEVFSASVQVMR